MVAIDLSKQQTFNADKKTIKQINFIKNLEQQATIFFFFEETKGNCFRFFTIKWKCILNLIFALI